MSEPRSQAQDAPRAVDCRLDQPALPALLVGGDEMLSPSLDPFHRLSQLESEGGDHVLLGIHGRLGAEPASDIRSHDSHLVGGETQVCGEVSTDRMWGLARGPDREPPVDVVPCGEHRPPLHGGEGTAMLVHLDRHHPFRFVEGAVDVSKAGSERAHQVRPGAVMRWCRVGVERLAVIDDHWQ